MKNRTWLAGFTLFTYVGLFTGAGLLTGCGGGSDSAVNNVAAAASQTTVEGSVFASYVNGATLSVEDISGNVLAGPVTTDAMGLFKIKLDTAHLKSALIFKSSGGSFMDESTGGKTSGGALSAYLDVSTLANGDSSKVNLTPGTALIQQLVTIHGKTLAEAKAAFESAFGYLPDSSITPTDASSPAAETTDAQKLAGLRAAAFSQLTLDLGLSSDKQFTLLTQLAADLADNTLDGMSNGSTEILLEGRALGNDIQGKFAQSLLTFKAGGKNKTELPNNKIGVLPFSKVALTDNYKVQYVPSKMGAMEGKTTFSIKVSDLSGAAVTGLNPVVMPIMNMAAHVHGAPVGAVSEDSTVPGSYNASVYYLMPSKMSSGMSMGYWDLGVKLGTDTVHFYPPVMMAMGDTAKAVLKGQNDKVSDMATDMSSDSQMPRQYYVFNQGLSRMGDAFSFKVFIAAKESMMSFPAVTTSTTLNAGTPNELAVTSVKVEMSTDKTNWTEASSAGAGIWVGSGLSGLTQDVKGKVYLRLSVNNEQKTDDGKAPDGIADDAEFSVTPSAAPSTMTSM